MPIKICNKNAWRKTTVPQTKHCILRPNHTYMIGITFPKEKLIIIFCLMRLHKQQIVPYHQVQLLHSYTHHQKQQ
jgi:hypothetical protein